MSRSAGSTRVALLLVLVLVALGVVLGAAGLRAPSAPADDRREPQREPLRAAAAADDLRERVAVEPERGEAPPEADIDAEDAAAGIALRGVVIDTDGSAVPDAWVTLQPADSEAPEGAATDAGGAFALPPLPPGRYALRVDSLERPSLVRDAVWLDAANPRPFERLELPRGATVSGIVQPPPPAHCRAVVVFEHVDGPLRRIAAAADGSYSLARMTPGAYRVQVDRGEATARAAVAEALHAARTRPDVELPADGEVRFDPADPVPSLARLRGRVVGHPRPESLSIRVRGDGRLPSQVADLLRAVPDPSGAFELDGVVAGTWEIDVVARDGSVLQSAPLAFAAGADHEAAFDITAVR